MNNGSQEKVEVRGISLAKPVWSEPGRNAASSKPADSQDDESAPNPEVLEKVQRRRFSVKYKARIVQEADACTEVGQIGALLRREGLYSSQLASWRRAYKQGALAGLRDNKRGRKQTKGPLETENERLTKKNTQLEQRLEQAQMIIDIQKKLSELLGIPINNKENEERS